jgi:iron complex outermembrane recepter protein
LMFLGNALFAQKISGIVTDKSKDPLIGASVVVKDSKNGAITDGSGAFTLNNVPKNSILVVSFVGHVTKEVAAVDNLTIVLEEGATLGDVIVTGVFDKRTALNSSIAITTLNAAQLDKVVPVSAADVLKNVPGVYVNSSLGEVRNTIYSRGVTTGNNDGRWGYDYVSMQEDGLPVTNTLYSNYGPDFFLRTDATLSKVEAVRGGSASIVGANAPGGIFNYISKTGGDKFEGEVRTRFGLEGNGQNPYYRADLNLGGPISKDLTYNIGGFYRTAQGSNYPGYQSNHGGQVKGNLLYNYGAGSLKFMVKLLDDHNLNKEALPTTSFTDPELVSGFTNTSSMLWPSMTATVNVPNRGSVTYDPSKFYHSQEYKGGLKWDHDLGDGWKVSNNMSYSHKNQDAFSPIGTVTPLDMTNFVSYIIAGSLHPGPPGAPGSFVVPGSYKFSTLSGTPIMTSTMGFDFSRPVPFVFNVTGNTGSAKSFAPNHLLFAPLIYNSSKVDEFMDQINFNKKIGKSTFNVGGFFSNSKLDRVQESFGVTLNTFEPNPKPLNITLTAPDGTVFQVTNPNGVSKLGADQGYTTFNATQSQAALFFAHTYEFTPELTLDWGLRYENLRIKGSNQISNNLSSATGGTDGNPLTLFDNYSNGPGAIFDYDQSKSYLSYSAALNYKISDEMAIYARYSNGKKAPGFQIYQDITTEFAKSSIDPQIQIIQQFEVGFKARTAQLTSTLTPFLSLLSHIPNSVTFTNNAGNLYNPPALYNDIRTMGLEIEELYKPTENFNVRGVITLQSSTATTYDSWIHNNATGADTKISNSGNTTANVPSVMFNITPEYATNHFYANLTWSYMGKRQANFANAFTMNAFSQFNLAAGYNITKSLSVSASINNLLNSYGVLGWVAPGTFPNNLNLEGLSAAQVAADPKAFYETFGTPARSYFLTASYKF